MSPGQPGSACIWDILTSFYSATRWDGVLSIFTHVIGLNATQNIVLRSLLDSQEEMFFPPENRSLTQQQSLLLTSAAPVAAGYFGLTQTLWDTETEGQNQTPVKL